MRLAFEHRIAAQDAAMEEEMNVNAIASRVPAAISAGGSAPKAASREVARPQSSTEVSLSDGKQTEPLTYSGKSARASFPFQPLLLPTRANVAMLAAKAGATINAKLDAAGISREPGFELELQDVNSAHVTVKGNRPDAKAIEDLINGDRELQMDIHNANALASHIPGIERAIAFQQECSAAQTEAEIDAIIARYSDLFNGLAPAADIDMRYGKDGLEMAINGEAVHA